VLAVAVSLAWFMDTAEPKDIIGAIAAYAVVLVVFVGVRYRHRWETEESHIGMRPIWH
jgi:hypothetical protein